MALQSAPKEQALFELLPTELLQMIVGSLNPLDIKDPSKVCKRLRDICTPLIFRKVKLDFSKSGFDGLQRLSMSDIRQHVISLTYEVPELLKTGKIGILI